MIERGLRRADLEEAISQSYDFIGRGMGLDGRGNTQAKRQSALEACLLEEATPVAATGIRGPRL